VKRNYVVIIICLLVSLFIYLFYRTEKTVVTEIFISIISHNKYIQARQLISNLFPLGKHVIYSLPEGLWVLCITLTSKSLFIQLGRFKFYCIFLPLIFSIGLELFQLLHLTNGRFDFWYIGISIFCWSIGNYFIKHQTAQQHILKPINYRSIVCFFSYAIVYLAHVWN